MTTRTFGYWFSTGLVALTFLASGIADLVQPPAVLEGMAHLGYPTYVASILGGWKLLGVLAVLVPGQPRLKEWAYAGMFFDLSGATISHAMSGDPLGKVVLPLIALSFVVASWALRSGNRAWSGQRATQDASSAHTEHGTYTGARAAS